MVKDSFAKGFKLANKSFGLALVFTTVSYAINLATSPLSNKIRTVMAPYSGPNPQKMDWAVVSAIVPHFFAILLISLVVNAYFQGGFWGYIGEGLQAGKSSIKFFIKSAFAFFPRMVGLVLFSSVAGLLAMVAVFLPFLVFLVLASLVKNVAVLATVLAILGVLAMIAAIVFVFYFMVRFFGLAAPIIVVQNKKILEAVKNSGAFLKKYFWSFVGLSLLYSLIYLVVVGVAFLIGFGASLIFKTTPGAAITPTLQILQVALGLVFGFIFVYISIAARTAFVDFYLTQSHASGEKST